ncbi:MAG: sigma 54-interacting transcriptional regulator [Bacillota bacterium]
MANTPRVTVVSVSKLTKEIFVSQVREFFGASLDVHTVCFEESGAFRSDSDIVLVSQASLKSSLPPLPPDSPVVVARRSLDMGRIAEVMSVPAGKALVVSNMREAAEEAVELLLGIGISHLEMIPYYPGAPLPPYEVRVAITPGIVGLVPPGLQVVDIGVRPLDVSTLVEVGVRLGLPLDKANILGARYNKRMVALISEQAQMLVEINALTKYLEAILNSVNDGVIAVDDQLRIIVMNSVASEITKSNSGPGGRLHQPQLAKELEDLLKTGKADINRLMHLNGRQLLVTKTPVFSKDKTAAVVVILKEVTELHRASRDLSRQIRRKAYKTKYSIDDILGDSTDIRRTKTVMRKIGPTNLTVLIMGEHGTGKELVAHALHNLSRRKGQPFVPVNLASLPETLIESELFGYEEGAFTGARKGGKPGLFEQAHPGTIFLDEIGDLPLNTQVKLLRVLEEKEVMRIGGTSIIPIDVRILAATNKDLLKSVRQGSFRADLYYRLCESRLMVPPLRSRKEDIPLLAAHFFTKFGPTSAPLSERLLTCLTRYDWPGNVRQLEGVIRYICNTTDGDDDEVYILLDEMLEGDTNERTEEEWLEVLEVIEARGSRDEYTAILQELLIAKEEGLRAGRESLVKRCQSHDLRVTGNMMRSRLDALRAQGCVVTGLGRQATRITERGEGFLRWLRRH